jgi:hypothetical protein
MWGEELQFRFRFDQSAVYDSSRVLNGWSKVFGIAEPIGHRNSCRLVFLCERGRIHLGMYCYVKGISPQQDPALKKDLCLVDPGQDYFCTIRRTRESYTMIIESPSDPLMFEQYTMPAARWRIPLRFLLHPYIGGRFTLDHDFHIDITLLKEEK